MNAEGRAGLRALADAATPGPWYQGQDSRSFENVGEVFTREDSEAPDSFDVWPNPYAPEDAAFIVAARSGVPDLLDTIDAVLALHQVQRLSVVYALGQPVLDDFCTSCTTADGSPAHYPCATVRAIEGAS